MNRIWITIVFGCLSFSLVGQKYSKEIGVARLAQTIDLDSTLLILDLLLPEIEKNGSPSDLCECLELKGNTLVRKANYDEAIELLKKALETCEYSKDSLILAQATNALGYTYDRLDEHELALQYFLQTADIYLSLEDNSGVVKSYLNAVSIFGQQEQFDKVKEYLRRCLDLIGSIQNTEQVVKYYAVASSHYAEIGASGEPNYLDSASSYALKGIEYSKAYQTESNMPSFYLVLASTNWLKGSFNRSIKYCDSIFLFEQEAGYRELILGYIRYAEASAGLRKVANVEKYYHEAANLIEAVNSEFYEIILEESKYESYKLLGMSELALSSLEHLRALESTLFTIERENHIAELEAKYESTRKQNEISQLQNQVAIQEALALRQKWVIGSGVLIVLMIMISSWFYYQRRISQEKEQSAIHKQQLLRSQINPHFIFNSLSSIRGFLFDGNDTKPAITYLGKFAKLMRMVLELSSKEWVSLSDEVRALELYLEIQQIRFNKAFDFDLSIDPSIDANEIMVPPLTAQPFIENAIEHGLKGIKKDGKVEVACLREHGKLVFKIQDNGIGIDHVEPRKNHQSRAIQIFRERLGIIGKRMKMSFSFNISDIGDSNEIHGTLVMYELPLVKA